MKTKVELRAAAIAARSSLSPEHRAEANAKIAARIAETRAFQEAKTIALYAAIKDEANPRHLFRADKRFAFPRVTKGGLELALAAPEALSAKGPFGIAEPPISLPAIDPGAIDLFIVPGLCFSPAGDRIGYGKGYYDALLARARAGNPQVVTIGFAFEAQLFDTLPTEPHDVRLDGVATEIRLVMIDRG